MEKTVVLRKNMAALLRRSAVDEEFRCLCLRDAAAAYKELTGQTLDTPEAICFIEPDATPAPSQELRYVRLPQYLRKTWLG